MSIKCPGSCFISPCPLNLFSGNPQPITLALGPSQHHFTNAASQPDLTKLIGNKTFRTECGMDAFIIDQDDPRALNWMMCSCFTERPLTLLRIEPATNGSNPVKKTQDKIEPRIGTSDWPTQFSLSSDESGDRTPFNLVGASLDLTGSPTNAEFSTTSFIRNPTSTKFSIRASEETIFIFINHVRGFLEKIVDASHELTEKRTSTATLDIQIEAGEGNRNVAVVMQSRDGGVWTDLYSLGGNERGWLESALRIFQIRGTEPSERQ